MPATATDCPNLAAVHRLQAKRLGPLPALRFKHDGLWHDLSWERYRADALACAAALADHGVRPGDRVGLVAENRLEWLVADLGILAAGAVNVPPHAPLAARQIHFQLADAGVRWLILSTGEQFHKLEGILAELPEIAGVVAFDGDVPGRACSWDGFLQHGRRALPRLQDELAAREAAVAPDDLATIMYTSGTTGNPKGVMLTHGNLLSNALACEAVSPRGPGAVVLNWLPFSHIYARTVDHYGCLVGGTPLCLAGCPETVVDDLADLQPTHMASVPRFYEKVLAAVAAPDAAETGRRLRKVFGRRIDWLSSGGAPLSKPVAEAYLAAGLLLLQGYGLTESSPVISFNRKDRYRIDTVGPPVPGVEVAIAPDGEVLTRGPHVMKGYWNNPAATAEAVRDGWLHTGDLGRLDDGFLSITGRKKELLVLSNGKKVVPTHIEGLLVAQDGIDQAVVCGEGRPYLTALIVPNWAHVGRLLAEAGERLAGLSPERLASRPGVEALLRRQVDAALADVSPWEQVRRFTVLPRPFSVAEDELTVSLKLRRNVVLAKHRAVIDHMYAE